jgi:hypothetical protein
MDNKITEREEIIKAKELILSDQLLQQSPAYKQSPNIVSDILTFTESETCSADTAFEILKMYQKSITVKLPDDIKSGDVGAKEARERLKIVERINSWWLFQYCLNEHVYHNLRHSFKCVLCDNFTEATLRRRSKKPKPQQQQARRPRQDNRHNNHPPRNDNRRNIRSASPWHNADKAYNHNQSVPSKTISNTKRWSNQLGRYV